MQKKSYPSLPQAWGIFGIFLAASIATGLAIGAFNELLDAGSMSFGNLIGYSASMLFVIWFAWRNKKYSGNTKIRWYNRIRPFLYPLLIILTLSFAVILDPLTNLLPMPDMVKELFSMLATRDIYTMLLVCLIGPLLEEILFRGIILEGFLNRYSPWKSIFWSSFLFGLFHLNPWQFIPGFLIGLLLGWVYMKTRSLLPVILIHMANNSLSYFTMYIFGEDIISFRDLFGDRGIYHTWLLSAALIFIVSLLILYRTLRRQQLFPQTSPGNHSTKV